MVNFRKCSFDTKKVIPDMDFDIMWKDDCIGHLTIKDEEIVDYYQTDCELWKAFIPVDCLKSKVLTIPLLADLFEERCWDRDRPDLKDLMNLLNLESYNPFKVVCITRGVHFDDFTWFRFSDEPDMKWKLLNPRVENFDHMWYRQEYKGKYGDRG